MYAVIETGGKQYRVEVGTELEIERLEAGPGDSVAFDRVLLVADGDAASIGHPIVANASVAAEVIRRDRGEKVISFKYRPKARRRVKKGHRQELTVIRISDIVLNGKSAAGDLAEAEERRKTERQRLEEGARRQAAKDAELAAKLAAAAAEKEPKRGPAAKGSTKSSTAKAEKATSSKDAAKATTKASAKTAKPAKADTTDAGAAKSTGTGKRSIVAKATDATDTKKTPRTRKSGED